MAQEIFDFPAIVTKRELSELYGLPCYKLKNFLSKELMEEINWRYARTFSPEYTRKLFMALSPTRYKQFVERNLNKYKEIENKDNDLNLAA